MRRPSDERGLSSREPTVSDESLDLTSPNALELTEVNDTPLDEVRAAETEDIEEEPLLPPRLSAHIILNRVAGTEEKRFVIGSVLIPLLITGITITIGAQIAFGFQDWQDRRSRIRDIIANTREAATTLSQDLEALAQKGGALERIWSNQGILDEIRAVEASLARLEGMSGLLAKDTAIQSDAVNHAGFTVGLERCRKAVGTYTDCLSKRLATQERGEQLCTAPFRKNLAAEGSCKALESMAYSIVY